MPQVINERDQRTIGFCRARFRTRLRAPAFGLPCFSARSYNHALSRARVSARRWREDKAGVGLETVGTS